MPQQFLYEQLDNVSNMGFLEEIKEKFKDKILKFSKSQSYKIIGVPFYNSESENNFKDKLFEVFK